MATLFFSYSHKDEELRDQLEVQLAMLKRSGAIEAWHDRKILAGDVVDHAIDEKMEIADVTLLLVSPDFLASDYCYDIEVKRAMELHDAGKARVIAVILRPCEWKETPFASLLLTPADGKPITKWPDQDEAFLDVVTQIRAALPPPSAPVSETFPNEVDSIETIATAYAPRSSNLRVKKEFSEAAQDRFMDECFEYMANLFEGSIAELVKRHPEIEGTFKKIDTQCFKAVIYRNGTTISRCSVQQNDSSAFGGKGITYSSDGDPHSTSYNEMLSIEIGDQSLSLKSIMGTSFMAYGQNRDASLSMSGGAEFYWGKLISPLQR